MLQRATVVGFSISISPDQGWYVPILVWERDLKSKRARSYKKVKYPESYSDGWLKCHWTGEKFDEFVTPKEYNLRERVPFIPAFIQRWLGQVNTYMWNAPFDINHTYINSGVDLTNGLFLDGSLMAHVIDDNYSVGLTQNAEKYKVELGINPHANAAKEKAELDHSIIVNGGTPGMVWRADLEPQSKYACMDTNLTFGLCQILIQKFSEEYGQRGIDWFFQKEVMPVCKEVVIEMKRRGVYIDVAHFEGLAEQNETKMNELEDSIVEGLEKEGYLEGFDVGKSIDEAVSQGRFLKKLVELEGLKVPTKFDKKAGVEKETMAKTVIKKVYQEDPHWVWGYILGEDEIKYSDAKVEEIKRGLYLEVMKRRHRFNIGSSAHLTWLFCDKLGMQKKSFPQTDSATKENPIPQMTAEVLEEMLLPKYEWVAKIMSWKKLQKMQSTYVKPALNLQHEGWLYMDMKQNGTISGRFSCAGGYNLQTLPRVDDELETIEACEKCHSETYDKDGNLTGNVELSEELHCMTDMHCKVCGHSKYDIPRPSAIKKGFIAPPGYKIVNADYSSLEPRCFAVMSGEDSIKQVYWDGLDLYSQVYCVMFDDQNQYSANPKDDNFLKKVAKAKRTWIKPVVLGIPYGAEEAQVASMVGAKKQIKDKKTKEIREFPDFDEGRRILDMYFDAFPNLKKYMDAQDEKAVLQGYVETLVGRRRHLPFVKKISDVLAKNDIDYRDLKDAPKKKIAKPDCTYTSKRGVEVTLTKEMLEEIREDIGIHREKLEDKDYWVMIRALMKNDLNGSKNTPIQGLAGHITNKGMLDSTRLFRNNNVDGWVCLQVHDEITSYVRDEQAEQGSDLLKQGMENNEFAALLDVAMVADPIICTDLKEAK